MNAPTNVVVPGFESVRLADVVLDDRLRWHALDGKVCSGRARWIHHSMSGGVEIVSIEVVTDPLPPLTLTGPADRYILRRIR